MTTFIDRSPGLPRLRVVICVVLCVGLGVFAVTKASPDEDGILLAISVILAIFAVLTPCIQWLWVDVAVTPEGIRIGARRATVGGGFPDSRYATRSALFAPWPAIHGASLRGSDVTRSLIEAANVRFLDGTVSRWWGWFPSRAAQHHLIVAIDESAIKYPEWTGHRTSFYSGPPMSPSSAWALPIRDVAGLTSAFANAPIELEQTMGLAWLPTRIN